MKHAMVAFAVASNGVDKAKTLISKYISEIREKEPRTLLYKSFQQADDDMRFIHVMAFEYEEAEKFHKETVHNRIFIEALYPLCTEMPKALTCNKIN